MRDTFAPHADGVRMHLRADEASLLRSLLGELRTLLDDRIADDAVTQRLFPATVTGDDDADREVRDLVHGNVHDTKVAAARQVQELLGSDDGRAVTAVLRDEEPVLVLGVLNDLRLALGARVGDEHLLGTDLDAVPPRELALMQLMSHLAAWQEELLGVLDPASLGFYDDFGFDDEDD